MRADQALTPVVHTQPSELQVVDGEPLSSFLETEAESSEFSVVVDVPGRENGPLSSEINGGNTFDHLSGSALSGAFSKALIKSELPAAEKARILTDVASELDPRVKDQLRRRWLSRLKS